MRYMLIVLYHEIQDTSEAWQLADPRKAVALDGSVKSDGLAPCGSPAWRKAVDRAVALDAPDDTK
jgi:hypothetical protein